MYEKIGGIIEVLETRERGAFLHEVNEELRKLTEQCTNRGGIGSIQITIKMKRDATYKETPIFEIQHNLVVKAPPKPRPKDTLFADDKGNLVRQEPNQISLDGMEPAGRDEGSKVTPIKPNEDKKGD